MAENHYLVLARKWRPQTFEEVVGQEHITRTLQNAIEAGRVGHAFLFIGSRGIGKTTTARILAKALNCLSHDSPTSSPCGSCANCRTIAEGSNIDVIEIDGASNNSVDDVREIREHVRMVPSNARYKIYIIDEVHQLSSGAFNALLKTLEEPPAHAVFVLATTEAHKIPATIISRCQRYDFRRVGVADLLTLLRTILDKEGVRCSDEALHAIARAAEGGIRDAESILDQLMSYCGEDITFQDVIDVLGLVHSEVLHALCDAILDKDIAAQLRIIEGVVVSGKDLSQFIQEVLRYFRNLLVCKTADARALLAMPDEEVAAVQQRADRFSLTQVIRLVEQIAELTKGFDSQLAQRFAIEAFLIRISQVGVELSVDTVLEKLIQLGQGGVSPPAAPAAPSAPENPKQAAEASPKAPAAKPLEAGAGNLDTVWARVVRKLNADHLSLAVWLGQATPLRVKNDAIVVGFDAEHKQACQEVKAGENRAAVEQALRSVTSNVTAFRTELRAERAAIEEEAPSADVPFGGHASLDDARKAIQDPHVARVLEVFKGRIVDVRRATGAIEGGSR